ncbi:hypothetical protein [Chitiniphilus shinanonensis]|uniref:hypothetical protein n=1 Tax=Chitiniphilus shinanonensis TaxID=553088 RepID=UPI00333F761E
MKEITMTATGRHERSSIEQPLDARFQPELVAHLNTCYDVASRAYDYAHMVGTMVSIMQTLQRGSDPLLQHALDVTGFIAEMAEHSAASDVDEARISLNNIEAQRRAQLM